MKKIKKQKLQIIENLLILLIYYHNKFVLTHFHNIFGNNQLFPFILTVFIIVFIDFFKLLFHKKL